MPIKQFVCPKCGDFYKILNREEFDKTVLAPCPECEELSPYTISVPAKRNPAHGIQR